MAGSAMTVAVDEARAFATSPAQFFGQSWHAMQHVERERLEELQLEALRLRFSELRDAIPTVSAMAGEQDVESIDQLDDIVPLLFQHSVYKSYPLSLLVKNRFDALTRWLDRLTTHDLSGLQVAHCDGLDSWLDVLESERAGAAELPNHPGFHAAHGRGGRLRTVACLLLFRTATCT